MKMLFNKLVLEFLKMSEIIRNFLANDENTVCLIETAKLLNISFDTAKKISQLL